MKAIIRQPDSFRCSVIKLKPAAFYYVWNMFIDISRERAVFIFRVHTELIGEKKNFNYVV